MPRTRSSVYSIQPHDECGVLPQENTIECSGEDSIVLPPKKRRRGNAEAPRRRHRGGQDGLCRLNLDELYIIFAYIYPMDLLNLAWTCKSLRNLLMHKSSVFLWRTTLRQIEGLPGCPRDLTEPQYTTLIFYPRCHGCDKPAKSILWNIRRRYCPACKIERLCPLRSCDAIIRENGVLPHDRLTVGEVWGQFVDRDKMNSLMDDYHQSSDKTRFLVEQREQRQIISLHAQKCESWQQHKGRIHRFDLEVLRKERQTNIFERLAQRGYELEIACFRGYLVERSHRFVSKKYKPLTDSEWGRIWPEWAEIMDTLRMQRLENRVYPLRRCSLVSEYNRYVTHSPPDSSLDLLPHVVELARFPPFRDIIETPEDIQMNENPFASAFAQLPKLLDEWIKNLNSEIAALVKIPSGLSADAFREQDEASTAGGTGQEGASHADLGKLHLACAIFHVDSIGAFAYPEVLSVSMRNAGIGTSRGTRWSATSSSAVPELRFLEEASYIIYACGLDPNVATARDMDHRNPRLRCLSCEGRTLVMSWRHAIWHARFYHCITVGLALSESSRWWLVGDEHIDAIQAVEESVQRAFSPDWTRCLLCRPCVGDAMLFGDAVHHLSKCHHLSKDEIQGGVHYKLLGIRDVCAVEMVQVGERVTFRVLEE